jgi:asparagine synthase (glutamine-hydrolysing)
MCGIAGVLRGRANARELVAALAHRGPDGEGSVDLGACSLAMTRLAILDPAPRSDQPMRWGDATIVFNGEIYNFLELRRELQSYGWSFETTGDTEVLLKALLQWGEGALSRVRGMYALLFWRDDVQELWAARDPFGIKPLYWGPLSGGGAVFASEAMVVTELVGRRVSPRAVAEFLHFGSPYAVTAFDGVLELRPGEVTIFRPDGSVDARACDSVGPDSGTVKDVLAGAVHSHLVSDRPLALFLSGGFDSALIASQTTDASVRPTGITIDTGTNVSDVAGARQTAAHYGLALEVIPYRLEDAVSRLESYLHGMDQPTIDGFNTLLVSDAANAAGFPVALSGLGGDEILGGYGYYQRARWMARVSRPYNKLPEWARPAADRAVAARTGRVPSQAGSILAARTTVDRYQAWRSIFTAEEVRRLTGLYPDPAMVTNDGVEVGATAELRALDFELYLGSTLLRDADVFSMACGVEVRVPLLDRAFVDHIRTELPGAKKIDLARVLHDSYLERVAGRKKITFRLPWSQWIETLVPTEELLAEADPWHGLVDPVEARVLVSADQRPPVDRLLALVVLARWLDRLATARRIAPRPV